MDTTNIFDITQETFLSYSLEKQLELFHLYLSSPNLYNQYKNNIYQFYSNQPYFKDSKNTFSIFKQYVKLPEDRKTLSPTQSNIIQLFFNISNPNWLYYKTDYLSLFFKSAFDYYEKNYLQDSVQPIRDIKQCYGNLLSLFKKVVLSLNTDEFDLFLVQMQKKYNTSQQELLCRIIAPHLSQEQKSSLEDLVLSHLPVHSKHTINWDYFCSAHAKNLYKKAPQILETLNFISEQRNISELAQELGRNIDSDKLKFYFDYYEQFPESFKQPFFERTLYQSLIHYNTQFSPIVEFILDNFHNHSDKMSNDTLIFVLWRTIHIVPKDEKNRLFDFIYQYVKQEGLQDWFNERLYSNTELSFAGNTVDLKNVTIQDFLKKKLYNILNIDLEQKEIRQRNKI